MTKEIQVSILNKRDLQKLCFAAQRCKNNIAVKIIHNNKIINAKSILGVLSLDIPSTKVISIRLIGNSTVSKEELDMCCGYFSHIIK